MIGSHRDARLPDACGLLGAILYDGGMPSVEIDLKDETLANLRSAAERAALSVPELIARMIERDAQLLSVDPDVAQATDEVIERYRPVLRRLAQ